MNATEVKQLWLYMGELWPHYRIPESPAEIAIRERAWMEAVGDLDPDVARATVVSMAGREFAPSPGQVREAYDELMLMAFGDEPPDPDEAWREVRELARRGGVEHPEWSHRAVAWAVDAMGWRDYRNSPEDDVGIWRAHFLRFYEAARTRHRHSRGVGLPPVVQDAMRALRLERPELAP